MYSTIAARGLGVRCEVGVMDKFAFFGEARSFP